MKTTLPRREFVQLAALGTAAAALTPALLGAEAEAPKKFMLKKAIMWGTVGMKGSVLERMQALKEAGFEGVEPNSTDTPQQQDEVVEALAQTGLKAASVCGTKHWHLTLSHPSENIRQQGLDALKQTLRDAKRFGAGSILLVPGTVAEGATYEQCWQRSIEQIRKAIPVAEECKAVISIENVWNNFITKEDEALRYLEEINSPWVQWHFDVGNIIWYGDPIEWIQKLGKRIRRLHIKEYSRDLAMKKGRREGFNAKFLEGANNWPGIMKALETVGYDGEWGIAEQGGGGSLEGLKDLSGRMDKMFPKQAAPK